MVMSQFQQFLGSVFNEYPHVQMFFHAVSNGANSMLNSLRLWIQQHPSICKVIVFVLGNVIVVALVCGILAVIGFTPGGIAAGSLAAAWHSSIGIVPAGSLFATLQSLTATGMIGAIGAYIGASISTIGIHLW